MAAVIEPAVRSQLQFACTNVKARTGRPDMVVLEHNHAGQIVSVRVNSSDQHPILFNKAEARGSLSCPCHNALVTIPPCEVFDAL